MCVRRAKHIHVDFLYRSLPPRAGRVLATLVDIVRTAFFAYMAVLVWRYAAIIHDERMTTIDFPKFPFFMMIFAAFVLMTLRSIQVPSPTGGAATPCSNAPKPSTGPRSKNRDWPSGSRDALPEHVQAHSRLVRGQLSCVPSPLVGEGQGGGCAQYAPSTARPDA